MHNEHHHRVDLPHNLIKCTQGWTYDVYDPIDVVEEWLKTTVADTDWKLDFLGNIYFKHERDAVLCKLTWC